MKKELSIVVPIYNVEKYLSECLNAFVNQTEKDFIAILIDDGSKDSSGTIAKDFADKYPDIFDYHYQENKGLGGARNTGLSFVKTEYVMFFDSDDFMSINGVKNIVQTIKKYPDCEILFFNPIIYDEATHSYELWHDSNYVSYIFKDKEIICPRKTPELIDSEASVCRAIWKKEYLNRINLHFLEHVKWEDVPPHFILMHYAEKAAFIREPGLYYYRSNTEGQITSGSGKSRLDIQIILNSILPYFKSKDFSKKDRRHMIAFLGKYLYWNFLVIDDKYRKQFVDICHHFFTKIKILYFLLTDKSCFKHKALIFLLKSRCFYKILYNRKLMAKGMKLFKKIKKRFKR